jgi:hypothetical protein
MDVSPCRNNKKEKKTLFLLEGIQLL